MLVAFASSAGEGGEGPLGAGGEGPLGAGGKAREVIRSGIFRSSNPTFRDSVSTGEDGSEAAGRLCGSDIFSLIFAAVN